jgi:hypothetical protein
MEIRLEIDDSTPVSGTVSAGMRTERFIGWLPMLRILADLLGPTAGSSGPRGCGDETGDAHNT